MRKLYIVSISVFYLWVLQSCGLQEDSDHAAIGEPGIPSQVVFGPLTPRMIGDRVQASGRVEVPPSDLISIHSRVEAFIDRIHVLPGDKVERGSRLFTISHPGILKKQRELLEAQAEWERSKAAYLRVSRLDSIGASYSSEREQARSDHDFWKARLEGLLAECRSIGLDVERIMETKMYQDRLSIRAPSEGAIQDVMVNRGMMVSPEQTLLRLTDGRHIHLELSVPAKDAARVQLGQKVHFGWIGSTTRYRAEVVKMDPILDESTGVLRVHCHLDSAAMGEVLPGQRILAEIEIGAKERYALPRSAVVKRGQEYFGFVRVVEGVEDVLLKGAEEKNEHILFGEPGGHSDEQWVLDGAYYLE